MPLSENASFFTACEPDREYNHPLGRPIVNVIRNELIKYGCICTQADNWRDSGWEFAWRRDCSKLLLIIAPSGVVDHWIIQICPSYFPGLIGTLLRRKPSASALDVYGGAVLVHNVLANTLQAKCILWCWDDLPTGNNSTSFPSFYD